MREIRATIFEDRFAAYAAAWLARYQNNADQK
jgi:hypothetical protein